MRTEILELACELVCAYSECTCENMHEDGYEDDLVADVVDLMQLQTGEGDEPTVQFVLEAYRFFAVCRTSHRAPFQENVAHVIDSLAEEAQAPQRTEEWYAQRHQMITASSAHKALGSACSKNALVCEKCAPCLPQSGGGGARGWGVKYEPLAVLYYEHVNNTKIKEYGCRQHPTYAFLGASPDGINVLPESPLYGRMLEIKNPYTRIPTGVPKKEYWVQMQLQMEVFGLNQCDFLETKFHEYPTHADFAADGAFERSADGKLKGVVVTCLENETYTLHYAPFACSEAEYEVWRLTLRGEWVLNTYWKLEHAFCTLVERNPAWFAAVLPQFVDVWATIEAAKINGWDQYLPKKKKD
jgi:putative phage-type endonuclease